MSSGRYEASGSARWSAGPAVDVPAGGADGGPRDGDPIRFAVPGAVVGRCGRAWLVPGQTPNNARESL
jgi:hypothetical protein